MIKVATVSFTQGFYHFEVRPLSLYIYIFLKLINNKQSTKENNDRSVSDLYIWYWLALNFSFGFYDLDNINDNLQSFSASERTKLFILEAIYKPCSSVYIRFINTRLRLGFIYQIYKPVIYTNCGGGLY